MGQGLGMGHGVGAGMGQGIPQGYPAADPALGGMQIPAAVQQLLSIARESQTMQVCNCALHLHHSLHRRPS